MDTPKALGRVMIVDSYPLFIGGIRAILQNEPDLTVVATATSAEEVAGNCRSERPDLVILGPNLDAFGEQSDQLGMIELVRGASPGSFVMIVTRSESQMHRMLDGLEAGAVSAPTTDSTDLELVDAVRATLHGGSYLPPDMALDLVRAQAQGHGMPLTDREIQILTGVAFGHTNLEIADRLGLSIRTVETERARVQGKLGLSGRPDLVGYAMEHRLLEQRDGWQGADG